MVEIFQTEGNDTRELPLQCQLRAHGDGNGENACGNASEKCREKCRENLRENCVKTA